MKMPNFPLRLSLAMWAMSLLGACSVIYDSQREASNKACLSITVQDERNNCLKRNEASHAQYEKQRQDVAERGTEKKTAPQDDKRLCFKRESTGETVCPN